LRQPLRHDRPLCLRVIRRQHNILCTLNATSIPIITTAPAGVQLTISTDNYQHIASVDRGRSVTRQELQSDFIREGVSNLHVRTPAPAPAPTPPTASTRAPAPI
jgi:hypothetical protein